MGRRVLPDGQTALTVGNDESMRWWDLATGSEIRRRELPKRSFAVLRPDGKQIIGGTFEQLKLWDAKTGDELDLPGDLGDFAGVPYLFSPDGSTFLTLVKDGVEVWDWPSGKRRHNLKQPTVMAGAAISPDSSRILTGSRDGPVQIWDAQSGQHLGELDARLAGEIRLMHFLPDGQTVALVEPVADPGPAPQRLGATRQVSLWDLGTQRRRWFVGPELSDDSDDRMQCLAVSPDGRIVAVGLRDGRVLVHEVASGRMRFVLQGHTDDTLALNFNADGKRLISGSADHTAIVWDVTLSAGLPIDAPEPTAGRLAEWWDTLASDDAEAVGLALAHLAAHPDQALPWLREHLSSAETGADAETLDRLFRELDDAQFAVRERASAELAALGDAALPGVQERLAGQVSGEVRRRAEAFLGVQIETPPKGERLRQIRALEVLEEWARPEAIALLKELANGHAGAWLAQEVRAVLQRME